jgi:hypothetical protein
MSRLESLLRTYTEGKCHVQLNGRHNELRDRVIAICRTAAA